MRRQVRHDDGRSPRRPSEVPAATGKGRQNPDLSKAPPVGGPSKAPPARGAAKEPPAGGAFEEPPATEASEQLELAASEARFRSAFQDAAVGMAIFAPGGVYLEVNAALCAILGRAPPDVIGRLWSDFAHSDDISRDWHADRADTLQARDQMFRCRRPDGTVVPVELSFSSAHLADGTRIINAQVTDVSERLATQDALAESEARYRNLIEAAADAVIVLIGWEVTYANAAAARLLGLTDRSELSGRNVLDFVRPDYHEEVRRRRRRVDTGDDIGLRETTWVRADGIEVHVQLTASAVSFDGRSAVQLVVRDMTALVHARADQAASEARFSSLVATSSDVILILDSAGDLTYASPSSERVTGWRPEQIVGRAGTELARFADLDRGTGEFSPVPPGAEQVTTFRFPHRDGTWRHIEMTTTNLLDHPEVGGYVLNLRDVTDRVEAQAAREAADARFRALVQNAADLIITFGPERTVTYTSPAVTRLLGFGPDDLLGTPGPALVHPEDGEAAMAAFAAVVAAGSGATSGPHEGRLRTANGGWCEVEARRHQHARRPRGGCPGR